jgi:hypothetical protein
MRPLNAILHSPRLRAAHRCPRGGAGIPRRRGRSGPHLRRHGRRLGRPRIGSGSTAGGIGPVALSAPGSAPGQDHGIDIGQVESAAAGLSNSQMEQIAPLVAKVTPLVQNGLGTVTISVAAIIIILLILILVT